MQRVWILSGMFTFHEFIEGNQCRKMMSAAWVDAGAKKEMSTFSA